jgi:membrane-bound lytic murein transglycosylase F
VRRPLLVVLIALACAKHETAPPAAPKPPPPPKPPEASKPAESPQPVPPDQPPVQRDLPQIAESKELRVLFTFNSTGYFIYRGETMGYEYDLLHLFAKDMKLQLVPLVIRDSRQLFEKLAKGEGDVVAAQLVAGGKPQQVAFSSGLYETVPVLVQRKSTNPSAGQPPAVSTAQQREQQETGDLQQMVIRARPVGRPEELAGQQVHVSTSSPYRARLMELNDELSDDMHVVEVDETTDRLIQRLSEGEIAFTVAPENLAALKAGEFTNLVIKPAIGPLQQVVWGLRANAPQLAQAIDNWLAVKRKSGLLGALYKKYFRDRRGFIRRAESRYLSGETGTLSQYDAWFKEYARIPGWDWRLVASQAYQESRFNPGARSWVGATGIMQIMPRTAREMHVNPNDPRQSIQGACRYLWKIDDQFKDEIESETERRKFILAAYNVGVGHVEDARRLATKHGDDASRWKDVAYWLVRKSERSVYNDPVVRYGFARGTEPVAYVDQILDRYEHYKLFVKDEPSVEVSPSPASQTF